ncbi:MAG TPA: BON domain-containing protein [Pyrinomonadaceae bacterium]|nr:BON domain-containing protein [Pyrinomonadaceae bacterium]
MRDSEIEQWVLRHLGLLELADSRGVCVVSRKGIVTLGGTVTNQTSKVSLHRAAREAKGVIGVINNLRLASCEPAVPTFVTASTAKVSRGVSTPGPAGRGPSGRAIATY